MKLAEFFQENPKVALGFSGGVDSTYLLWAAHHYGADVKPYFINTPFQPQFELEEARKLAEQIGVQLTVIDWDILSDPQVAANPADRCYYCKATLFGLLKEHALADGYEVLIDGTNASDDASDRPGMRAMAELSVRSPLRECGISKSELRLMSKLAGLPTWNRPGYSCLATRVPTGRTITHELLQRVERAETALFALNFSDFRVRVLGEAARLQFPADQIEQAVARREEVIKAVSPHFDPVLLDLVQR